MNIAHYIAHPEKLDRTTLFELRELVARHPYFQAARLLFLKNLFLLHDETFQEEVRRAALMLPDRSVLFNLVEAHRYTLKTRQEETDAADDTNNKVTKKRAGVLISDYLTEVGEPSAAQKGMKPTIADATTDYIDFLIHSTDDIPAPKGRTQGHGAQLIDDFLESDGFALSPGTEAEETIAQEDTTRPKAESKRRNTTDTENADEAESDNSYFTETLAKIYIKQGRYERALEIIKTLNANYPKENSYFADQIRFLEKLILNNKHKK